MAATKAVCSPSMSDLSGGPPLAVKIRGLMSYYFLLDSRSRPAIEGENSEHHSSRTTFQAAVVARQRVERERPEGGHHKTETSPHQTPSGRGERGSKACLCLPLPRDGIHPDSTRRCDELPTLFGVPLLLVEYPELSEQGHASRDAS